MMMNFFKKLLLITAMLTAVGCQKGFLERKPNKALLVPKQLADFEALMDNIDVFNVTPSFPVISSDDFMAVDATYNAYANQSEKNAYTWGAEIDETFGITDWNVPYQQIFYANVVLDGLADSNTEETTSTRFLQIRGAALFHRAFAYHNLAQSYAQLYSANTINSPYGLPLRLTADVNLLTGRSTVGDLYDLIVNDLKSAATMLPESSSLVTRPTRAAAWALLARVYLSMSDYSNAEQAVNEALKLRSSLIDYNTVSTTAASPFPATPATTSNPEVIFYARLTSLSSIGSAAQINFALVDEYAANDLRKAIFFTNRGNNVYNFKGRYTGSTLRHFSGLGTDELYLIKAECLARQNKLADAQTSLNTLLLKRWKTATYQPAVVNRAEDLIRIIIVERRKELLFRGQRWSDLRRFNLEPEFAITLTRQVNGQQYQLAPNSNRYIFPIPNQELSINPIPQNPR